MPAPQDVRKSILVIKGQANSLQAVEQFLRNREWKIQTATNLKEALTYLVSQKPSFVMISMDHPNRKVRSLPKILDQAFPVFVMVYSESNTTISYKNLLDSGCNYRINPPATGPAVERTINKILKDQELERERQEQLKNNPNGLADNGDNGGEIKTFHSDSTSLGGVTHIAGSRAGLNEAEAGSLSLSEILRQMSDGTEDGDLGSAAPLVAEGGEAPPLSLRTDSKSSGGGGMWVPLDTPSGEAPPLDPADPGKKLTNERPMARYDEDDINAMDRPPGSEDEAPVLEFDPAAKKKNSNGSSRETMPTTPEGALIRTGGRSGRASSKVESIMVRGTQAALDESVHVQSKSEKPVQKIQDSSNVACLVVESPRFSGYLVTALGKNRKIDEKFIETIRERLFKFLKENGEDVANEGTMSLRIKRVDFEDWALECAEFLRKSVHNGEEIAMAFFPFSDAKTKVVDSASVEMGAVDVREISADVTLEFNLYIYLPTNNKYVLYTPRGAKFYGTQKDRLMEMGVSHVHVKRTEVQDVDKYRAQNYLNSKIDEFQSRKKGRLPDAS